MNYFSLWTAGLIFITLVQQKHFVQFNSADVHLEWNKETGVVTLPFIIQDGLHIQAVSNTLDNVIPTEISFEENPLLNIEYYRFSIQYFDTVLLDSVSHNVISGNFEVKVFFTKAEESNQKLKLAGHLTYQACNDKQCFFPRSLPIELSFERTD